MLNGCSSISSEHVRNSGCGLVLPALVCAAFPNPVIGASFPDFAGLGTGS